MIYLLFAFIQTSIVWIVVIMALHQRSAAVRRVLAFLLCFWCASALAAGPTTQAVNSPASTLGNLTARTLDLHTATGDVGSIAIPSYVTKYQITAVKILNCSTTPVLAQVAVFTGAGGTGTTVVAAATITGATSASVVLSSTLATTAALTASTIFVRLTVANVAALTCDVHLNIDDLT